MTGKPLLGGEKKRKIEKLNTHKNICINLKSKKHHGQKMKKK